MYRGRVYRAYFDALKFLTTYTAGAIAFLILLRHTTADAFSAIGLAPFLSAGSYLFGFYDVALGILLNAAVFTPISHFLTMRFIEQSRLDALVDIDEGTQAAQNAPAVENKGLQHT